MAVSSRTCFLHRTNQTYVYQWTYRQFQQEQVEWDDVNKLLQHHGFKPVYFTNPIKSKNLSELVLLDKRSAAEIRVTLKMMLKDSERRQNLIQELIKSNNELKEKVQEHMGRAAQQSWRATELEGLLDELKTRVQDLEDRYLGKAVQCHSNAQEHTQMQQEKQEAQNLCEDMKQQLLRQREKSTWLQRTLDSSVGEEERDLARRSQTSWQIFQRVGLHDAPKKSVKGQSGVKETPSSVTSSFKAILKDQQRENKAKIEEPKMGAQHLKQELDTRPTLRDVKFLKHKLRRLEALNSRLYDTRPEKDNTADHEHISDQARESSLCVHYHLLLTEISAVVSSSSAVVPLDRLKRSSVDSELAEFQTLLPTLKVWAWQLHLLEELQRSLIKLASRLVPWQLTGGGHSSAEGIRVEDMMLLVDTMLEDTSADNGKVLRSPTRYTLTSMVSHFQKLFDVTSLSGVLPCMNKVYTRLGEMNNAMRHLRDVLNLDCRMPPAEVVNHVARLVSSGHTVRLYDLLGDADIDSIIVKVKQHEEFFPAFHDLIKEILHTLGVSRLNDILPAMKSLIQAQ